MQTVRQAEQELADYLVAHPELYKMQLQIDKGLEAAGPDPRKRMLFLSRMMEHFCIDMLVEIKILNQDLKKYT